MKAIGLDIGTTTVCGVLVDAKTGELLDAKTLTNDSVIESVHTYERTQDADKILVKCKNILEEERTHFGKWDIEFEKKRMLYDGTEIVITDLQWDILQLLMSDTELSFSIKEIAYATNTGVHEAKIYVEDLLKTIKEQTDSAIVQKKEERYAFVEITD